MKTRRLLSILLVLALCASLLPVATRAVQDDSFFDDNYFGDNFPWCGNEGCGPGDCIHVGEPSMGNPAPILTAAEQLLQTHTPIGSGYSDGGGQYIVYAVAGGGTQLDSWDKDNNRSTWHFDQYGNIIGAGYSSPEVKFNAAYASGTLISGTLTDNAAGNIFGYTADENSIFTLTHKSLDGIKASAAAGILTAGVFQVDTADAAKAESYTDADGNTVTVYTFADETVATHILYPNGSSQVTITKADGSTQTCSYNANGEAESQGVTISPDQGKTLADAAKASNAANILIDMATGKVAENAGDSNSEIPGTTGADQAEVTLPAAAVGEIASGTNVPLTISTSVADVTIPSGGLTELASQGGDVTVSTQKNGNTVELNVTAGGKPVDEVPGGVTLTVPVGSPGTVALQINPDGTREVLPSASLGNQVYIPLEGSVTIELQDNTRSLTDVPTSHSWSDPGIQWAAAQGIIGGAAGTPDPDSTMTQNQANAMLQKALGYFPATGTDDALFSGTSSDSRVTQSDYILMLWRYAGSPGATPNSYTWQQAQDAKNWLNDAMGSPVKIGGNQDVTLGEACAILQTAAADTILRNAGLNGSIHSLRGYQNLTDESTIRDTDMAEEITAFTKNNILIQAAQDMLDQANQLPENVLSLLQ